MKLHLPKMLLTAVLAAVMMPTAWAGWGENNTVTQDDQRNTYFFDGDVTTAWSTADSESSSTTIYLKPGTVDENTVNSGTMSNVTIAEDDKLVITGLWNDTAAESNFSSLTLTSVTGEDNSTLEIGGNQGSANGTAQVVYVNNNAEKSYNVWNTIVNAGATLDFSDACSSDAFNHETAMTMTVGGTLQLGKTRQTLGTFTLTLNNGTVLGSNNKTDNSTAGHGGLDFKKATAEGKIVSTGTSTISCGIRLNRSITIDVQDGTLTVDNIMNGGNNDDYKEGITKQGAGTLVITASKTYAEGFYAGNTTLEDGGTIKYDISSTTPFSYAGTISGTGNIEKAGTAAMTIAGVSGLDGDITVSGGSLTITALDVSKTLGVSVGDGSTLSFGTVTVDALNHALEIASEGSNTYYTTDGTNASTNGFLVSDTVYRLFDGYEWNGTVDGFEVSTADGDTLLSTKGAGTVFYVNEETHAISPAGDYINGRATRYIVESGATLVIDGNQSDTMTAAKILAEAAGEGNALVTTEVTLVGGTTTQLTGALSVAGGSIKVSTDGEHNDIKVTKTDLSSFSSVSLNNASIEYLGAATALKNVTVGKDGASLKFRDMAEVGSEFQLTGTTTLNGALTIGKMDGQAWKYSVHVAELTGNGDISITSADEAANLVIDALTDYQGNISVIKGGSSGSAALTLNASKDQSIKGLSLTNATATILNLSNARATTISSLTVTGQSTIGTKRASTCYNGTINIDSLSNTGDSATLTLKNGSQIDTATVFNLSGTSSMTGTINVQSDAYRGSTDMNANEKSRELQVNLNSKEVAANAVINFQDATTLGDASGSGNTNNVGSNYNILGVGVDGAKVAGLTGETSNAATVKSTEGNRTLEIVGSGIYTTNAKVESNVKLLKSGSGTQNFSGDMSSFNGTVEVSGGTLGFTKTDGTVTVSSLTLSGGKLDVTNSLTLSTVTIDLTKYEAGTNIDDLVAAGTLLTGENYSVSYVGGVTTVGSYTGTVKKVDNSLVLTWADAIPEKTSLTTTITGVSGLFDSEKNMLTLNIGADDSLANVGNVTISGISDDIMKDILGLDGLPEDGMVGITLLDKNGEEFTGGIDGTLVFQGNTGVYEGVANVGSATQYYVAYIPEPTTATLSLLALAGLAARRRRKA